MKTVTIQMTRKAALSMGLLTCACGWPPNNHFDFGKRECAHNPKCKGYKEVATVGKVLKQVRRVTNK